MPRRFDFISPGVSIKEIDQSTAAAPTRDDGILLIGTAPQGPANYPVKVRNLDNFYRVFGRPISGKGSDSTDVWRDGNRQGTTYAMYAAQAWLASNTSPVTFVRLLGEDQKASKQAGGYDKAGWNTVQAETTVPSTNATAYGLWIFPSGTAANANVGTLGAVIYASASAVTLQGRVAGRPSSVTTSSVGQLIQSNATSGKMNTFTLEFWTSTSAKETHTVHFDRTQKDGFIRNVLNCNPQKLKTVNYNNTKNYFLGATFEESVDRKIRDANSSSAGQQYGLLMPLATGSLYYSNNNRAATAAKTGYFINRNPAPKTSYSTYDAGNSNAVSKLFRLCSLHEGEWFGQNYGCKIHDLRIGTTANPTSTFSLSIVDSDGIEVETFSGCNLDESSPNFIGKKVGDQYQTWDQDLQKYRLYGEYPNRSDFFRVEMHSDWKAGISDKRAIPWGFLGPMKPINFTITSGSNSTGINAWVGDTSGSLYGFGQIDSPGAGEDFVSVGAGAPGFNPSYAWPQLKLTDQSSNNNGNYTKDYVFGVRHMLDADNKNKKILWYSPCYKDLVRALPAGLDIHGDTSSAHLKRSFIFTLDDIIQDNGNNSEFYYSSGSHAAGTAMTVKSGSAKILTEGVKQFQAPFVGGFDGLDITLVDPFSSNTTEALSGKSATNNYAFYTMEKTIDMISDKDLLSYDMVSVPGLTVTGLRNKLVNMAEDRADTLAIIDIDSGYKKDYENSGTETLGDSAQIITNAETADYDSSYAAAYYPPVRLRDTAGGSNDITIVPPSVAGIGAIGRSEQLSQGPWFAPAGFNRGGIGILGGSAGPRVVGTIEHLTKQNRDDLYEVNINPIARFPSIGSIVIFGQKTLQQKNSALDRINVRRLMIFLKKRIGKVADTILFSQNVETTWNRFKASADRILSDVKSRFGITKYKLVLDKTTTTPDLIDRNIMYAKIFVQPARSVEFIAIDFVITNTGIEL